MDLIDLNKSPSRKELRIFALLLVVFGTLFGLLIWRRPEALLVLAIISSVSALSFALLNRGEQINSRWLHWSIPLKSSAAYAIVLLGLPAYILASGACIGFVVTAVVAWARPKTGEWVYFAWVTSAHPIGWTVSHLLLAFVYFVVLTPIGLAMRLAGRDPLQRQIDPEAKSYWVERKRKTDSNQYFRQF